MVEVLQEGEVLDLALAAGGDAVDAPRAGVEGGEEVRGKRVKSVVLQESAGGGTEIQATREDGSKVRATATYLDRGLVGDLINNGVKFDVKPREEPSFLLSLLDAWATPTVHLGPCGWSALHHDHNDEE